METSTTVVAMTGMLASFGLPLLVIAIILVYKHHRNRLHQETILRLAEKGLPVPPELLQPPVRSPSSVAMRSATARAAMRLGSSMTMRPSPRHAASSSASGTTVLLPAPGGASSTTGRPAASAAASSGSAATMGSGGRVSMGARESSASGNLTLRRASDGGEAPSP